MKLEQYVDRTWVGGIASGSEGRRGKTTGSGGNGEGRQRHGMR